MFSYMASSDVLSTGPPRAGALVVAGGVGHQAEAPVAAATTASPRAAERQLVRLLGPAFVAAIAYVDPGNVAANLSAGAGYGYLLVWVLVLANAMAVIVQYLSAKLGVVTGQTLPELLGARLPRAGRLSYWAQAEITAAATDVAEVVGGALALQLLFGCPLLVGGALVGLVSMALLEVQSRGGHRRFELVVVALLAVIVVGFGGGLLLAPVHWGGVTAGLVPRLDGAPTLLLAASMMGATVMPHAVHLHSALARDRHRPDGDERRTRRLLRATRWDVTGALAVAGAVNIAMLLLAAGALRGVAGTDTIEGAARAIAAHLGPGAAAIFAVGLLASGLASTAVGSCSGAAIMDGLLHVRVPILLRRLVTLVPALLLLGFGADPTRALVVSQVVLSAAIPFVLVPLTRYTGRRELMGPFTNGPALQCAAAAVAVAAVVLNAGLLVIEVR